MVLHARAQPQVLGRSCVRLRYNVLSGPCVFETLLRILATIVPTVHKFLALTHLSIALCPVALACLGLEAAPLTRPWETRIFPRRHRHYYLRKKSKNRNTN